jgi:hypothetical protein
MAVTARVTNGIALLKHTEQGKSPVQSPESTVAASTDGAEATNPVDRRSRKRRRPPHARTTPSGPKRRRPVAEIIHPEQHDIAPPPLSQSAHEIVSSIIKATEGSPRRAWPPINGRPSAVRPAPFQNSSRSPISRRPVSSTTTGR